MEYPSPKPFRMLDKEIENEKGQYDGDFTLPLVFSTELEALAMGRTAEIQMLVKERSQKMYAEAIHLHGLKNNSEIDEKTLAKIEHQIIEVMGTLLDEEALRPGSMKNSKASIGFLDDEKK